MMDVTKQKGCITMNVTVGMKGIAENLCEKEDTALEVGSGSLLVYATPCMAALMEGAACAAIEEGLALPAEQGVILIGEVGINSVMFIPATDEDEKADLSANKFSNSATSSQYMESNDYILAHGDQGVGFYHATPNSILNQGKAFFRIFDNIAPFSLVLKFGGSATDINAVTTGTPSDDELIYDIYGRRVTEVKKGNIYIKNGKKFIVK
jgi:hypothetical protein